MYSAKGTYFTDENTDSRLGRVTCMRCLVAHQQDRHWILVLALRPT